MIDVSNGRRYLVLDGSAILMGYPQNIGAGPSDCANADGVDCPACTGEGCYKCGAGLWRIPWIDGGEWCEHDVLDRHENIPDGVCPHKTE